MSYNLYVENVLKKLHVTVKEFGQEALLLQRDTLVSTNPATTKHLI